VSCPKPGTDRRYRDGRPHDRYEAEALGAAELNGLLPEPLDDVLDREAAEREQ
jgi:hypothetical protein